MSRRTFGSFGWLYLDELGGETHGAASNCGLRDQVAALAGLATCSVADVTLDDSLAAMAERALATAPPRFALAGLSMGGYLAFEILRQAAPGRVTRLALLDTSARPDTVRLPSSSVTTRWCVPGISRPSPSATTGWRWPLRNVATP